MQGVGASAARGLMSANGRPPARRDNLPNRREPNRRGAAGGDFLFIEGRLLGGPQLLNPIFGGTLAYSPPSTRSSRWIISVRPV
jgi:hypothetical protein